MKKFAALIVATSVALSAGAAYANKSWEDKFDKMDTNNDDMISMEEYNAHGKMWFNKMDADGDGMISMEEKKAAKDMKHDKMDR